MTRDPAYYRDLLDKILLENTDDEIPSMQDVARVSRDTMVKLGKAPAWYQFLEKEDEGSYVINLNGRWALPDGNHVSHIFAHIEINDDNSAYGSVSATVETPYTDESHPYGDDMVADEITNILHSAGFPNDIWVSWSENGMQDLDYFHFDSNLAEEIAPWLKDINL